MNFRINLFCFLFPLVNLFFIEVGQAQFANIKPKGLRGSVGFGLSEYKVQQGTQNFKLDDGKFTAVQGETELAGPLLITVSMNFLKTSGRTNYNSNTLSQNYSATDIAFDDSAYQLALGFKFRPFASVLSPYIEAGGILGYHEIQYKDAKSILPSGGTPKTKDALTETGYYGDAGVEVHFSDKFGLCVGYRMQQMQTKNFATLGDTKVKYDANIIHFGVITQF
jgi:opacity protein-like surface antigen